MFFLSDNYIVYYFHKSVVIQGLRPLTRKANKFKSLFLIIKSFIDLTLLYFQKGTKKIDSYLFIRLNQFFFSFYLNFNTNQFFIPIVRLFDFFYKSSFHLIIKNHFFLINCAFKIHNYLKILFLPFY